MSDYGKCHWCDEQVPGWNWHHTGPKGRVCCRRCYNSPSSNYRRVYGPNADGEQEDREAQRGSGRESAL